MLIVVVLFLAALGRWVLIEGAGDSWPTQTEEFVLRLQHRYASFQKSIIHLLHNTRCFLLLRDFLLLLFQSVPKLN